ncbi:TetR/AcrR family transcriptional regulator [Nonomuraea jabiensis]|uniref:AcrR family transcriptional regulator n=1 Tax=Nonomuraea jabiensis TaxID=882448 RepID=A0A7W9G5Y0_9ACTN|nr:TetR/AcrR family transcriptional regulator [Nonomuraea jabiensis]MBB5777738.1 AcrR family transcriptional regulator [Nonomuraea jabiensis]
MAARRAPRPEERGKAAELTRERILRAAVSEFGEKGYSGARTAGIAARAGVNQQLISYYFGGKQGLLEELRRRRQAEEASFDAASASFAESVAAQLERTLDDPEWARLVVWQALGDCPFADAEEGQRYAQAQRARMAESLERMRGRQEAGEVTGRVDPAFALLVAYAVVFAPITMPQFVRDIFGDDPLSPEVRRRLHGELIRLLGEAEN